MARKAASHQVASSIGADITDAIHYVGRELDAFVRTTIIASKGADGSERLRIVHQLYRLVDERPWVLAERTFYWPNNEGRDLLFTMQLELHRAYHKWGDLVY